MQVEWKGVFPALLTPFTSQDELDLPLFETNLQAQVDAGVSGVIIGGSLGEASTLMTAEKERLVKAATNLLDSSIPVIMNIAEGSTRSAIDQAALAARWGASGLMLLPPMRYKSDDRETVHFFLSVAKSTELPIMIYNNPVDYKIEVTLDMFEQLTSCKNIQAVKESTRDVSNVTRMINRFSGRFKMLCGVDTIAMEEILMGADGWVAGLVDAFPRETVAVYRLLRAGRHQEANQIVKWFLPLLELDLHPKLVQYIKLAAAHQGIGSEYVRPPRLMLEADERARIMAVLDRACASRPVLANYSSIPA
jgi:4-hydroxy-tetrahydrodipicolinate synthase